VCARMERRHNLRCELGYEVWTPSRMLPRPMQGRRCWVVGASCTFSVARIALRYCMHDRKVGDSPSFWLSYCHTFSRPRVAIQRVEAMIRSARSPLEGPSGFADAIQGT